LVGTAVTPIVWILRPAVSLILPSAGRPERPQARRPSGLNVTLSTSSMADQRLAEARRFPGAPYRPPMPLWKWGLAEGLDQAGQVTVYLLIGGHLQP
jgi:hypothetical protein